MLQRANRLTKDQDFKRLRSLGRSFFSGSLRIRAVKNGLNESRFGIVVSSRVHKHAVKRNLVKRRLREIIRKNLAKIRQGFDMTISPSTASLDKKYAELEDEVIKTLIKAKLYE